MGEGGKGEGGLEMEKRMGKVMKKGRGGGRQGLLAIATMA